MLVGPKGGIKRSELGLLTPGGWSVGRLEGNVLRFETAAVV
jgi:16S rRNA U1498 N3-methylase RsmE